MIRCLTFLSSILLAACATNPKSGKSSRDENCFAHYQAQLGSREMIWGFGESGVRTVAIDAARTDLAKQISVHVTSSTELKESNTQAQISSLSRSMIDRNMDGVDIDRICQDKGRYQAIVKLSRSSLLRSVESRLNQVRTEALGVQAKLDQNSSLADQMLSFVLARDFLAEEADSYRSYLTICEAFQGCRNHNSSWLADLRSFVRLNAPNETFTYHAEDELAADLQAEISKIIRDEGYRLSAEPQAHLASVRCNQINYDQNQQLRERLVRIHCQVSGEIETVEIFKLSIAATGSGSNIERAYHAARTILKKE